MPEVTQLLDAIDEGNPKAAEELLPMVYEELRKLAFGQDVCFATGPDLAGHSAGA